MHGWGPHAQERQDGIGEGSFPGIRGPVVELTVWQGITYRNRGHQGIDINRGLDQAAPEREHLVTFSSRPFRENAYIVTLPQRLADHRHHPCGIPLTIAVDKDRAGFPDQVAEQWPVFHLQLGHKSDRQHAVDGMDIYPGDMVGYKKHAFLLAIRKVTTGCQFDIETMQ